MQVTLRPRFACTIRFCPQSRYLEIAFYSPRSIYWPPTWDRRWCCRSPGYVVCACRYTCGRAAANSEISDSYMIHRVGRALCNVYRAATLSVLGTSSLFLSFLSLNRSTLINGECSLRRGRTSNKFREFMRMFIPGDFSLYTAESIVF